MIYTAILLSKRTSGGQNMEIDSTWRGVWPTMVTPFYEDGRLDLDGTARLTEWFIEQGVAGLFTVCLSSEMYELTPDERLQLATAVVKAAGGRIPVAAGAVYAGSIAQQAEFARRMADTGVDTVVVIANQLVGSEADECQWQAAMEEYLSPMPDKVRLGVYECPVPYHRLLSPELLGWVASTGRFVFTKDTCTHLPTILEKLEAIKDSGLGFYNAHTATLLASLRAGGSGYSGTAANVFPKLLVWLCEKYATYPREAESLQNLLSVADSYVGHQYPSSAKERIRMQGVAMETASRKNHVTYAWRDRYVMEQSIALFEEIAQRLPK